jgi:hypothetical protein
MRITGYRLREAIKMHELRRNTWAGQFENSLRKFSDEDKTHPSVVAQNFLTEERAVAKLQAAQARYNLVVTVTVLGERMTLCEAVKRVGGAGRVEGLWRAAAGGKKDPYGYRQEDERDPTKERARQQMSIGEITKEAQAASKYAGSVRSAIATANTQEVEIEDLDAALFE